MELLDTHLPLNDQRLELVTLLDAWMVDDDSEEHRETGEPLVRAIDKARLADRQRFLPWLKAVPW